MAERKKSAGGRRESPTSARQLAIKEKQQQAMSLRLTGLTYRQIADQMGGDPGTAEDRVKAVLRRIEEPMVDEYRALNVARIERLLFAVWQPALAGDDRSQQQALRLIHELNMLVGAYAPLKQEVTVDAPEGTLVGVVTQWVPDDQWFKEFAKAWAEVRGPDYVPEEPKDVTPQAIATGGDPAPAGTP